MNFQKLVELAEIERQRSTRAPTIQSDVAVPLLQAIVTGLLTGLVLAVVMIAVPDIPVWVALVVGGLGFLLMAVTIWFRGMSRSWTLLHDWERVKPERGWRPKRLLQVELRAGTSSRFVDNEDLGMEEDCLIRFARALAGGQSLSESRWGKDRKCFPEGINQFRFTRTRMERQGLVERGGGAANAPFTLTADGRAFFGRIAEM